MDDQFFFPNEKVKQKMKYGYIKFLYLIKTLSISDLRNFVSKRLNSSSIFFKAWLQYSFQRYSLDSMKAKIRMCLVHNSLSQQDMHKLHKDNFLWRALQGLFISTNVSVGALFVTYENDLGSFSQYILRYIGSANSKISILVDQAHLESTVG